LHEGIAVVIKIKVSDLLGKHKMTQKESSDKTGNNTALYHETIKRLEIEHLDKYCDVFDCQPGGYFIS
jgi:putative transcriptional regulator